MCLYFIINKAKLFKLHVYLCLPINPSNLLGTGMEYNKNHTKI